MRHASFNDGHVEYTLSVIDPYGGQHFLVAGADSWSAGLRYPEGICVRPQSVDDSLPGG